MRKPKKPIEDIPTPTEEELLFKIKQMPEQYAAYACFIYLFGNRVSEALGGQKKERVGSYEYTHPRTGKVHEQPVYKTLLGKENILYEPLKKWAFRFGNEFVIVSNIPTLKRRADIYKTYREAYVYANGPNEKEFIEILNSYIEKKSPNENIFTFNRRTAWKHISKNIGIPPHKLRGMRATKDAVTYDLDATALKRKYNWATDGMAMHYASKNQKDIMAKMKRSVNKHDVTAESLEEAYNILSVKHEWGDYLKVIDKKPKHAPKSIEEAKEEMRSL